MLILWWLQLVWRQHSKKWQISPSDYWSNRTVPCSAAPLSVQSSYRYENVLWIGGVWGIVSMLKSLQKQLQRRHKQLCLKIDTLLRRLMFPDGHFNASSANRRQCASIIFGTPGTVYLCYSLRYHRMFTQFSLRAWASKYTCHPIIANLLYMV